MNSPVSLVLVSHSYPPVLGGSEIEAQRVCAGLIRRGHSITVLCAGGPPMPDIPEWVDPEGVPVRILARRGSGRWRDIAFALQVAWILLRERRRYQLVYFLMQGLHLATGLPVAHSLGKPVVMKVSGSSLLTAMGRSPIGRQELRWLGKWAHRIMILNDGMVKEAVEAGLPTDRLLWMPNPVDTEEFAPCTPAERLERRIAFEVPPEAAVIVFVGRLAPEKELPSLIDGFAEVATRAPNALLVLIGEGPERSALERQVQALGLAARVRFPGRLPMNEVRRWLQCADVFTLVSSNEGFPCSLVEAMSVGLPSVASNIPANTQLIDPSVHGLLSDTLNAQSIAECLIRLLQEPGERERMGRAARRRVIENYSMDKVLERYEALFRECLSNSR